MSESVKDAILARKLATAAPIIGRQTPLYHPFYKRPQLSEAVYVTLCIGALAHDHLDERIVLATDYRLSNDWVSSDKEWKLNVLSPDLVGLYAGSPGRAREWALMCREHLANVSPTRANLIDHLRAVTAAFKARLKFKMGLPYAELLRDGPSIFGADEFRRRLDAAIRHKINLQMIIAGFVQEKAVLLRMDWLDDQSGVDFEEVTHHTAIGTGFYDAYHALMARSHSAQTPLEVAIYHVYEAKRAGERSPGVGETTRILVLRHDQRRGTCASPMMPPGEKWVERLYRRYRPRPIDPFKIDIPDGAFPYVSPVQDELFSVARTVEMLSDESEVEALKTGFADIKAGRVRSLDEIDADIKKGKR